MHSYNGDVVRKDLRSNLRQTTIRLCIWSPSLCFHADKQGGWNFSSGSITKGYTVLAEPMWLIRYQDILQ